MDTALTYAAVPLPKRRRRLRKWTLRILVLTVAGLAVKSAYTRARLLENNPDIGPVAWGRVLTSPALLKMAWAFSNNPRRVEDPTLFGVEPDKLAFTIEHPLSFQNNHVQIQLTVRNTGSKTIVLPPLVTCGNIRYPTGCTGGDVITLAYPVLGRGLTVIPPGQSAIVPLHIPASRAPDCGTLSIDFCRHVWRFWIWTNRSGAPACKDWSEVPLSNIVRDPESTY